MADEPNRTSRDYAYNSPDHEVQYFRAMIEKVLSRSREAMASDVLAELPKALVKAQAEFTTPKRNVEGQVGNHKYKYADLQSVYDAVREPLARNGLAITHLTQEFAGQVELVTLLLHESGEWLRSVYPVKAHVDKPQSFGSAMTYAKRYALSALLAIASEEDDDAQAAEGAAKTADSRSAPVGATQAPEPKMPPASSGPPLSLMSPETGEIEATYVRNAGGAKEFMRQLEAACAHSSNYWRLHKQEAEALADHPSLKGRLKVDDEPIAAMVERLESMYGSVAIEEEDGGASPLM